MGSSLFKFQVLANCDEARAGVISTPHGSVATPSFLPVATQATVKGLLPEEIKATGANIVLSNIYHLYLRPGIDLIEKMGGLHAFMRWDGPILTDSGGFQIVSMGSLVRVDSQGAHFRSHIDGSLHIFTPERVVDYQERVGADIIMCLDQCIVATARDELILMAMERTHRWAERCRNAHKNDKSALFGIVQGGTSLALRDTSAQFITSLDFSGYAIGGLAVGESKETMYQVVEHTNKLLPTSKPRYLMGVGSPEDLVECVARGTDFFDCALPTRVARNRALFSPTGRVDITASQFRNLSGPIDGECDCTTCLNFSAAYLHHLFKAKELLGLRLATIHNLRYVHRLMEQMRVHILDGTFEPFAQEFFARYRPTNEAVRQFQKGKWLQRRQIS